jgi:hypothetical protein
MYGGVLKDRLNINQMPPSSHAPKVAVHSPIENKYVPSY